MTSRKLRNKQTSNNQESTNDPIIDNKSNVVSKMQIDSGYSKLQQGETKKSSIELNSSYVFSESNNKSDIKLPDIIGSFGLFQLLVLIFSGLREGIVGYDAVVLSIVTQPETRFLCADNYNLNNYVSDVNSELFNELLLKANNVSQCYQSSPQIGNFLYNVSKNDQQQNLINCQTFIFNPNKPTNKVSLVTRWSLVCDRGWLVAFAESAFFLGLVSGNLLWGYYSDKVGRRKAYLVSHFVSLIFGSAAVFASCVEIFIVCRYLSGLGSIGYNVIYTIQVEIIGTEHRSYSTILNHLGWGIGVLMVPLAAHTFNEFVYIVSVAPFLVLLMTPWAFWLPESPRWLMANDSSWNQVESERAKQEVVRAAKLNGKPVDANTERNISLLNQMIINDKIRQESRTDKTSYLLLLTSWTLVKDLLILSYVAMLSHLFYYGLTINFSYIGSVSMEANFIISGTGEWVGCVIGAILMKELPRRTCMFIFLITTASSFAAQAVIDLNFFQALNSTLINTTNNAVGTVSTLSIVFVVLIVNQEVFPTVIRQTGSSIVNTIGESGSALAPLLTQLSLLIGSANVNLLSAMICLIGAFSVYFLSETSNIELNDTVNDWRQTDVEIQANGRHSSAVELQLSFQNVERSRKNRKLFSKFQCLGGTKPSIDDVINGDSIGDSSCRADAHILNDNTKQRKKFYGTTD